MAPLAKNLNRAFTYADYLTWTENERWEIIEGVAYDMSPAPNTKHQSVSFRLSGILYAFLKDKRCQAFAAPFDVRIAADKDKANEEIETVVQTGSCGYLRPKQA